MEELEEMKKLVDKFIKDAEEFIKEYKEKEEKFYGRSITNETIK